MYTLFVDLDGVLVDFEGGVHEHTGRLVSEMSPRQMWPWLARIPDFYARLKWTSDGKELWGHVLPHSPIILTGLPMGNWARPQKLAWCERELGRQVLVVTCMSRDKAKVALEYAGDSVPVLVDDRESIRDSWESMGGNFILHRSAAETIVALRAIGL